MAPQEALPDDAPLAAFFAPNVVGMLLALGLEKIQLEATLQRIIASRKGAHPYSLLGLGLLMLALANSYLSGSVVKARVRYNVKLPNLYANKTDNKDAVLFNCIQRGHQNFLEQLPLIALSMFFLCTIERPNTAALLLCVISLARVLYAAGYRSDNVKNRLGPILVSFFCTSVGIGYGALAGLSLVGIHGIAEQEP